MNEANAGLLVLREGGHRHMPWKNGLGATTEIIVFPADAGLVDFEWRVSMATVANDGAFSAFEGVDRTLTVLSGDGLNLAVDHAEPVALTVTTPPFSFPADAASHATLIGSPVTDLNVMTRRGRWDHRVTRMGGASIPAQWAGQADISIWFCGLGLLCVQSEVDSDITLEHSDAIVIQKSVAPALTLSSNTESDLFLIELDAAVEDCF